VCVCVIEKVGEQDDRRGGGAGREVDTTRRASKILSVSLFCFYVLSYISSFTCVRGVRWLKWKEFKKNGLSN